MAAYHSVDVQCDLSRALHPNIDTFCHLFSAVQHSFQVIGSEHKTLGAGDRVPVSSALLPHHQFSVFVVVSAHILGSLAHHVRFCSFESTRNTNQHTIKVCRIISSFIQSFDAVPARVV